MPWSFVDVKAAGADDSSTTTIFGGVATTEGETLIVCSSNYTTGGVLISDITDTAGNEWVKVGTTGGGDANHKMEVWEALVTVEGVNTVVTITYAAGATNRKAALLQYSGLDSPAFDAMSAYNTEGSPGTTHTTNGVTTTADGDLLVGFFINWSGDPGTASSSGNTTLRHGTLVTSGNSVGDANGASAGSHTTQIGTTGSTQMVTVASAFKALSDRRSRLALMGAG